MFNRIALLTVAAFAIGVSLVFAQATTLPKNYGAPESPVSTRCVSTDGATFASCGTGTSTASASAATLTEGQTVAGFFFDLLGNLKVTLGTLFSGEDLTHNVMRVEGQFSYLGNTTADAQVKSSAGFVHTVSCQGTDATATAGTIILYDNTAESGTQIWHWDVQAVALTQPFTVILDAVAGTGLYLGFTTTTDVTCTVTYR